MKCKTLIALALCVALAVVPMRVEADSEPRSLLYGLIVTGVILVVVGTGAYVIYQCDKAQKNRERCNNCSVHINKIDNFCPACGVAQRCEDCDTRLPKGSTECPFCQTKVPPPQPALRIVQSSADGITWSASMLTADNIRLERKLTTLRFKDQAEFDAWKSADTNLIIVSEFKLPPGQFFIRLSSQ